MKGQEAIKKARRAGKRPKMVFVSSWTLPGGFGDVYVSPDENLGLIDWRFLVGCTVNVDSTCEVWLKKAIREISEYANITIGVLFEMRGNLPWVVKMFNSDGDILWQE